MKSKGREGEGGGEGERGRDEWMYVWEN